MIDDLSPAARELLESAAVATVATITHVKVERVRGIGPWLQGDT